MLPTLEAYATLTSFERVALWGAMASIVALIPSVLSLAKKLLLLAPRKLAYELWFVFHVPRHYILLLVSGVTFGLTAFHVYNTSGAAFIALMAGAVSGLLLLLSLFLRQNRSLLREQILSQLNSVIDKHGTLCAAIKYDVDLLVAINDFSYATGGAIINLLRKTLQKHERRLTRTSHHGSDSSDLQSLSWGPESFCCDEYAQRPILRVR